MNQTQKHTTGKKLLALLLALIMSVSLLPMSVFAADLGTEAPIVEGQIQQDVALDESDGEEDTTVPEEPVTEDPAPVEEPTEDVDTTDDIATQAGDVAVQAAEISYVTKTKSVSLKDNGTMGYRIIHIDCGRKYFSADDLKQIIDYAYKYGYTHVELAFGNDGLRFLLDDMFVSVNGEDTDVTAAIQYGNKQFDTKASYSPNVTNEELSQSEMTDIIAYAKGKGIGIIPMFDVPGHLYAVIQAMQQKLGVDVTGYYEGPGSGSSPNWAISPTNVASVNFVQALVQKYITYFKEQGCTMFNIAADESGISTENYLAYAKLVNSVAAMVQNAGMTALAFNDGIYNPNYTSALGSYAFDSNIAICYWDAGGGTNYAQARDLADKGFKIINTHNGWYYVIGKENITGNEWSQYAYTCQYAKQQMSRENSCLSIDGDSNKTTPAGCMAAIWCDYPSNDANWENVESYIRTLAQYNTGYFTKKSTPVEVTIVASATSVKVGDTVTLSLSNSAVASWSVDKMDVIELISTNDITGATSVTAKALKAGTATVTATVDGTEYTTTITVTDAGEIKYTEKTINLTVGGTATDVIEGAYNGSYPTENTGIAIVEKTEVKNIPASTGDPTKVTTLVNGNKYIISDGNGHFLKRNGTSLTNVTSADEATEWTITQGTSASSSAWAIKDGNYYLSYYSGSQWKLNVKTGAGQISWSYNSNGFKYYNDSTHYIRYNTTSGWDVSTSGNNYGAAYEKGTPTPGGDQTTITFKGVAEGKTTVIIGHVKYTINVTKENLDGVDPLPIQLWITNNTIQVDTTDATKTGSGWGGDSSLGTANYVAVSAEKAYGEQGITVVEALGLTEPLTRFEWGGTRLITAKDKKPAQELVFWTGRIHNSSASNIQTVWGKDYSNAGDAFNYVRYYGGVWQVSADGVNNWTTVTGAGSTGQYSGCTQQLAAYYMTRTQITQEVTTDVADWGKPKDGDEYDSQVAGDFVLLDYAVKYADGKRVPNTFPVSNKTLAYHCADNDNAVGTKNSTKYRMLNNFRGIETENFEVYMITVTMTSGSASEQLTADTAKDGYTYDDTTEQIVWAIDEDARAQSGLADYTSISGSSTYSGCKVGGAMDIRGVEIYNKHGALITYYVRAKAAVEDKLIVNYYVQGETTPFYSYEIAVKADTTFDHGFARTTDPLGLTKNSVENIIGQQETVNWQLEKMPQIKAQYRYSEYDFVDANIDTNDYKTVNLYYTFKAEKTFVVDFGLPLKITPGDINKNLVADGVTITGVDVGNVSNYARIAKDNNFNITYTLIKTIDGSDTFSLQYDGKLVTGETGTPQIGQSAKYSITVIPASTVYYEDSFAKFYDAGNSEAKTDFTATSDTDAMGTWYVDGTEMSMPDQALEELGKKNNVYGYDPAYTRDNNSTTFSMGSAKKVTVDANTYETKGGNPTAQFTFKGTGFDVISLTDNRSGAIKVEVYNASTQEKVKGYFVNNYYGYTYTNGAWEVVKPVEGQKSNAMYQIPVIKVADLPWAEYNVVITAAYSSIFDTAGSEQYSFWLDAVRVYDPMGKDYDYKSGENSDNESYPQFIRLRNALADKDAVIAGEGKVVFIDGGNTGDIATYANYGPNNEVYLANGQAISFKVPENANIASIQIGAKAPLAKDGSATLTVVNGATLGKDKVTSIDIGTATEMYYELNDAKGQIVTITNNGDSILSLTNLKITFTAKQTDNVVLASFTTLEQTETVEAVRALFAAPVEPEPDPEPETFEPERFEVSWNRSTVKVGQKATLTVKTSEDVDAITVDGETVTNYRTRTQRTGWGWNAKKVTYREFTYTVTAAEAGTLNYSVVATDADGVNSEAFDAPALTVQAASQRPGIGGWLDNIFGRWF